MGERESDSGAVRSTRVGACASGQPATAPDQHPQHGSRPLALTSSSARSCSRSAFWCAEHVSCPIASCCCCCANTCSHSMCRSMSRASCSSSNSGTGALLAAKHLRLPCGKWGRGGGASAGCDGGDGACARCPAGRPCDLGAYTPGCKPSGPAGGGSRSWTPAWPSAAAACAAAADGV